mmetsp:Transcript_44428/g.90661  ORF Transcript_44428/g.90661 Transcript_44428/m.90661 type:complete len:225 (-) Transcript_44428:820-1494(-)
MVAPPAPLPLHPPPPLGAPHPPNSSSSSSSRPQPLQSLSSPPPPPQRTTLFPPNPLRLCQSPPNPRRRSQLPPCRPSPPPPRRQSLSTCLASTPSLLLQSRNRLHRSRPMRPRPRPPPPGTCSTGSLATPVPLLACRLLVRSRSRAPSKAPRQTIFSRRSELASAATTGRPPSPTTGRRTPGICSTSAQLHRANHQTLWETCSARWIPVVNGVQGPARKTSSTV